MAGSLDIERTKHLVRVRIARVLVRGTAMITSVECREHAAECRQMAEHAPNLRVRTILIDIARTWERLADTLAGLMSTAKRTALGTRSCSSAVA